MPNTTSGCPLREMITRGLANDGGLL
jgi:hypothetical protein